MFIAKRKTLIKSKSRNRLRRILHLATADYCKMQIVLDLFKKRTVNA